MTRYRRSLSDPLFVSLIQGGARVTSSLPAESLPVEASEAGGVGAEVPRNDDSPVEGGGADEASFEEAAAGGGDGQGEEGGAAAGLQAAGQVVVLHDRD